MPTSPIPVDFCFAHQIDIKKTAGLLKTTIFTRLTKEIIEKEIQQHYTSFFEKGVEVTPATMAPEHNRLSHCATVLDIPLPRLIISNELCSSTINGFALGSSDTSFIFISPGIITHLDLDELTFLMGHECGHIAQNHVLYHTMINLSLRTPGWIDAIIENHPLLNPVRNRLENRFEEKQITEWKIYAEISADRAGLLCCQNLETAEQTIAKSCFGPNLSDDLLPLMENDPEENAVSETHLPFKERIKALRAFAESSVYRQHTLGEQKLGSSTSTPSLMGVDRFVEKLVSEARQKTA